MLVVVVPVQETVIAAQVAAPCDICIDLSGTPKDCTATLTVERTIVVTATLRDRVELTVVV